MPELKQKHIFKLTSGKHLSDHLLHFVNKWLQYPPENIPDHILDMLIRFSQMRKAEQRKFMVVNDELYCVEYDTNLFVKHPNRGWTQQRCVSEKVMDRTLQHNQQK